MSATFAYVVVDRTGRRLRGQIEAGTQEQAADRLRERGDTVVELSVQSPHVQKLKLETNASLSDRQVADFALDLRSLVLSGAPLPRAFAALASSAGSQQVTSLARDLKLQLELGNPASLALSRAKSASLRLFGRFLGAAEQGGRYDIMLAIAADYLAKRTAARERVRSAAAYPLFLLAVSLSAICFLTLHVAPTLAPLFEEGKAPAFIAFGAAVGGWVNANPALGVGCLGAAALAVVLAIRSETIQSGLARAMSAIPGLDRISTGFDFGPALLTYSALLRAGWPAERALRLTVEIAGGRAHAAFTSISTRLRDGSTLTEAFRNERGFPTEIVRAVEIGEETGAVADTLQRAAEHMIARALKTMDRLTAALAPVMIALIGGLVAAIMISLLSSIGELGDAAL